MTSQYPQETTAAVLADRVRDQLSAGNYGRVATSRARIEIRKRVLSDGSISLHGAFRARGRERTYLGYISVEEIKNYGDRLKKYRPKNHKRRDIAVLANVNQ